VLQDVRYPSGAWGHLVSLGELHGKGYVYRVVRNKLTVGVKKDKKLALKGMRNTNNNLYIEHVSIIPGGAEDDGAVTRRLSLGNRAQ
jgi:hypothetical protein